MATPNIEDWYRTFGDNVCLYRELSGLSQIDLGLLLEPPMTRENISHIEHARKRTPAHRVPQLARALNVSVEKLMR